jgi:type 1 glutamine amidotransferase
MKKALMVWGGWDGHEPKQSVEVFAPFLQEQGYESKSPTRWMSIPTREDAGAVA